MLDTLFVPLTIHLTDVQKDAHLIGSDRGVRGWEVEGAPLPSPPQASFRLRHRFQGSYIFTTRQTHIANTAPARCGRH